ncbi:sialate O-acetylesterase [Paraglaciecola sp.]|uniref:sialate O-acetylesterase n=1 Tax=Paraglaciecola sp. TaxID=1920173 RepID=UPI003EF2B637
MKSILFTFAMFAFLSACSLNNTTHRQSQKLPANKSHYSGERQDLHVYLLIGQSNMAGRAPITAKQFNVIENTLLLDQEGQWQLATNPLNRFSTIRKNLSMQKLGIGYSFANVMTNELSKVDEKIKLGLVVNAKGGTSITKWKPGQKFYDDAIRRANLAKQNGTLKGILWHQGETDFEDKDYLSKLVKLVKNLRRDLAQPNLPFVAGQINKTPLINEQITQLPKEVPFTEVVILENLKAMDRWHFDNDSIQKLGEGYAKAILILQKPLGY